MKSRIGICAPTRLWAVAEEKGAKGDKACLGAQVNPSLRPSPLQVPPCSGHGALGEEGQATAWVGDGPSTSEWPAPWLASPAPFGGFSTGAAWIAAGPLAPDGIGLAQGGRTVFAQQPVGLLGRAFNWLWKGEGVAIGLAHDKMWDDVPQLEGQGAGEGPQPVALGRAGYAAVHLQS